MKFGSWVVREGDEQACRRLASETGLLPLTARLLVNRGITTAHEAECFLDTGKIEFHDPFLLKDMDAAVERINRAINGHERVCIYGDYDVDGVTSTVLLYLYLRTRGIECECFIPERLSEGYGLSLPVIERLKGKTDLIITVDTGVTAVAEAEYAKSVGIDMVITDHHSCRETLPPAAAVVNPHRNDSEYPFLQLAGVGVVFKLLCALDGSVERILDMYSDIIALGTIADVMPIVDENRRITATGLEKLAKTENHGLKALMRRSGVIKPGRYSKKITSSTVGFVLAPRINAAGRIACASLAVDLLLAKDDETADRIAVELCEINKKRQITEQEIFEAAVEMIESKYRDDKFLVLAAEGWHQGVIGVVASKVSEKYSRPCVLFSIDGDTAKGSGRSIRGFSLMNALSECGDMFIEYGGHELAAGLSIRCDMIDAFRRRVNEYAAPLLTDNENAFPLEIESEANFSDITEKGITEMLRLEPFGLSNPQPVLVLRDVFIKDITPLSQGKHIRMRVFREGSGVGVNAVWFGMSPTEMPFREGEMLDIAFTADINEYMGLRTPQIFVRDAAYSRTETDLLKECGEKYSALISGRRFDGDIAEIPTLADFRSVFKAVRRFAAHESRKTSLTAAARAFANEYGVEISLCKLKLILAVLAERRLITLEFFGENGMTLGLIPAPGKTNIDDSPIMRSIHENFKETKDAVRC